MLGSVKIIFVGAPNFELNQKKLNRVLDKSKLFNFSKDYETILNVEAPNGVVMDHSVFEVLESDFQEDFLLYITTYQLQNNYFFRISNFGDEHDGLGQDGKIKGLITTHDVDLLSHQHNMSLERVMAFLAVKCLFLGKYLRNGGRYWDLYTENVEASVWYFARDKMKALYNVRNPYVGDRGKTVLRSYNFTERDIQNLDHDLKLVNPSRFESAKMWASSRPITTGSLISFIIAFSFFVLGVFIG